MGSSQKQRWLCLSRQMKENTRSLAGPDSIDKHPELIFFLKPFVSSQRSPEPLYALESSVLEQLT